MDSDDGRDAEITHLCNYMKGPDQLVTLSDYAGDIFCI